VKLRRDHIGRSWLRLVVLGGVFIGLLVGHQFIALPGNLFGRMLQNALHIPAFTTLGFALAWCFPAWKATRILATCLVAGVMFEGIQYLGDRDASIFDLGLDLIGASIAVFALFGPWQQRNAVASSIVLLLMVTFLMPGRVLLAYWHRDSLFPGFLDAGNWLQAPLVWSNSPSSVVAWDDAGQTSRQALRVCWSNDRYPGVHFDEVVSDWNDYETLVIELDIEPDVDNSLDLTVAVGYCGIPGTSGFTTRSFPPGRHRWTVPVIELLNADSRESISHLIVHTSRRYAGRCVVFAEVRLE